MKITTRAATGKDREWLFALKVATMRDYVTAIYGWDDGVQRRLFDEQFDPATIRILQVDGHDAGLLEVRAAADHLFLARIEILPAFQRQGIGSAVIRSVIAGSGEKQQPVHLQVLRSNPARALYERLGFTIYEETPTHLKMKIEPGHASPPAAG